MRRRWRSASSDGVGRSGARAGRWRRRGRSRVRSLERLGRVGSCFKFASDTVALSKWVSYLGGSLETIFHNFTPILERGSQMDVAREIA